MSLSRRLGTKVQHLETTIDRAQESVTAMHPGLQESVHHGDFLLHHRKSVHQVNAKRNAIQILDAGVC